MVLDAAGLRVLSDVECLQLLASVTVGRVALSHRAMPMILPVRFQLLDERILIRTMPGTTLYQATDGTVVAFEAEGPPGRAEPDWSVVVHGVATHRPAPPPASHTTIEITTAAVSGRQVMVPVDPIGAPAPHW